MPVGESNIKEVIIAAWTTARHEAREWENNAKAANWVDCLARGFQSQYQAANQRVFWRKNPSNQKEFSLNELLFDIAVCEVQWVPSVAKRTQLPFVAKCYWQVESELNDKNSREITKDFSKLVMGKSDSKLFISSFSDPRRERTKELCAKIARYCRGNLYLCFIPHPRDWGKNSNPEVLRWAGDHWCPL